MPVDVFIPDVPAVKSADEWRATAERLRADTLSKVIFRGQAAAWRDATTRVEFLQTIDGGPGYHIRKLRFEAIPGLWINVAWLWKYPFPTLKTVRAAWEID